MSIYRVEQVAGVITGLTKGARIGERLRPFLGEAAVALEEIGSPSARGYAAGLRGALAPEPTQTLRAAARALAGDEAALGLVAPMIVNRLLHDSGDATLRTLIEGSSHPRFDPNHVVQALRGRDDTTRIKILRAADRQAGLWLRLQVEGSPLPARRGILAWSLGDFDAVALLFHSQGLSRLMADASEPEYPYLVALSSRSDDDVAALLYTAGLHKRGLPLHQMGEPYQTVALPREYGEGIAPRFLFHSMTQPANRMGSVLNPDVARLLPEGALVVDSTKSFGQDEPGASPTARGQTMDDWVEAVRRAAGDRGLGGAFVAGYTGATGVFEENLPTLPDGSHGLAIGIGAGDIERGRELGAVWTGRRPANGIVETFGGAQVIRFSGPSLRRPVTAYVYNNPFLRKVQRLAAVYKNLFSGFIGQGLFDWAFKALLKANGVITPELIAQGQARHGSLVDESRTGVTDILVDVEGTDRDKVILLPPTEIDLTGSWGLREGGIQLLLQLIHNLFFGPFEDGEINPTKLDNALTDWRDRLRKVLATRNPAAGVAVAAGVEALRFHLVDDPKELMPRDREGRIITFEGYETAAHLHERHGAEALARLPQGIKRYIEAVRLSRQPQVLPPQTRESLIALASLLANRSAGIMPRAPEARAFLHRPVKDAELADTLRWIGPLTVQTFIEAVQALREHLDVARKLIRGQGAQYATLSQDLLTQLDGMIVQMEHLAAEAGAANTRSPLTAQQVGQLLHALKLLITDGDRIYHERDLEPPMRSLLARTVLIVAYLRGQAALPYPEVSFPLGYEGLLPTRQPRAPGGRRRR